MFDNSPAISHARSAASRSRWAAIGAAVAVTIGAVGIGGHHIASADVEQGERPVFVPINPCRLIDTRPGDPNVGSKSSPLGPDETVTVTAHGENGNCTGASTIPTDAVGLSLNVTAVGQTERTFLTVWGDGADPGTSNLNPEPGQPPTPNAVNTPLSPTGTFNIRNNAGEVHTLVDVVGYYANHNHDDRYYTESESDQRFARAATDVTRVNPYDFSFSEDSGWRLEIALLHGASAMEECSFAPLRVPLGRTIDDVTITYAADTPAEARLAVIAVNDEPGTFTSDAELIDIAVQADMVAFPTTGPGVFEQVTVAATDSIVVAENMSLAIQICTSDDLAILGVSLSTPLP